MQRRLAAKVKVAKWWSQPTRMSEVQFDPPPTNYQSPMAPASQGQKPSISVLHARLANSVFLGVFSDYSTLVLHCTMHTTALDCIANFSRMSCFCCHRIALLDVAWSFVLSFCCQWNWNAGVRIHSHILAYFVVSCRCAMYETGLNHILYLSISDMSDTTVAS